MDDLLDAADVVPALLPDGQVAVPTDCPSCGWPERLFDLASRLFGCMFCPYTSDERNA